MVAWWYKFASHFGTIKIIQKHSKMYSDVLLVPYFRLFGKLTLFDINIHYAQQITRYRPEHARRRIAATRRCNKFHCVKRILINEKFNLSLHQNFVATCQIWFAYLDWYNEQCHPPTTLEPTIGTTKYSFIIYLQNGGHCVTCMQTIDSYVQK